ncbi:uncharacterized protein LOC123529284 [Mercenaria mercenaria]|uniref:uncharacterized protein LOC123529284 n=1 Tax=Mercenaria mercenaria TaxID=6596 RepID=UPI00234F0171|nr:uncharacterized protein LOC123529284 [Mercenaria mercenaria]
MKNCCFFLVSFICFVFLSTAAVLCTTTFDVKELNACPPQDSKFLTLVERSLEQCVEECARRKSCAVVGYKRVLRLCELHMKSSTPSVSDNHCIMIMRDDIHGLKQDSCGEWQVFETIAGVEHCTVKECKPQPYLRNGQFLGNKNEVGSKKAVKCNHGYIEENNTKSVECLKEGIWSRNVSCVLKECPNEIGIIELKEDFRLKIFNNSKSHENASNTCANEPNGHLVVLDKEWKMDAVSNILTSCSGYEGKKDFWTDGNCFSKKCNFTVGESMPTTQKFWHINKSDHQQCVRLQYVEEVGVYRWNDTSCSAQYPFICEY